VEKNIDYKELYKIQDSVLDVVFSFENDFYLTGGTALHRFYYGARYSDDLDFFANNTEYFGEDIKEVVELITDSGFDVKKRVSSRDFYRFVVEGVLQIDFVNDRVYRHEKSVIINNKRIDNKINILTNKIGAIIDRDEEKDIFDLFCFSCNEEFNWGEILEIANKKSVIEKDILIYRLKTFPIEWLKRVKIIKNVNISKPTIEALCDDILYNRDNSFKKSLKLICQ